MKNTFKPLGVAAAVAAASAGYVNVANAQAPVAVANNALGDLALVPYYTVQDNWITGIHIVNSSDKTQIVKFRFRRALDSLDALDFNVVMSPQDVYAGSIRKDEDGVFWSANDTTCTSPESGAGVKLGMPDVYNANGEGESGYVEIIAMGSPTTETLPLPIQAKHVGATADEAGVPRDCTAVDRLFEADGESITIPGVVDNATAWSPASSKIASGVGKTGGANTFVDSDNVLKVSYFMRNRDNGVEFGDNAVHIQNFLTEPAITNQEFGWLSGDLNGFDFPDLDGGDPVNGTRGRFNELRAGSVLGVDSLLNEWAANGDNLNSWVVTLPGQYTMLDTPQYVTALADAADGETAAPEVTCTEANGCDYRDIPVNVTVVPYDREEEDGIVQGTGSTVVSPSVPGQPQVTQLKKEVNIITFAGNEVIGVGDNNVDAAVPQNFGWASLEVAKKADRRICDWDGSLDRVTGINSQGTTGGALITSTELLALMSCTASSSATGNVPMIGFAAWARQPAGAAAGATYGRIVGHSFVTGS